MLDFLLGALAALLLVALAAALRIRRWRRLRRRLAAGAGPRWLLRRLFLRLGTRPEQETALAGEADALAAELHALRQDGRALREELARLLAAPALDAAALDGVLEARMARLQALRARIAAAAAKVHATLDERQRQVLSAMLVAAGWHRGAGHGGRC